MAGMLALERLGTREVFGGDCTGGMCHPLQMDMGKLPGGRATSKGWRTSLHRTSWVASPEACTGMTQLRLAKENSCSELKALDGPRVSVLLLEEVERYLYSERIFLPYFH